MNNKLNNNCDKIFREYLINFLMIMDNNFSDSDLNNLKKNIETLKINYSNLKIESSIKEMEVIGIYDSSKNVIKVRKNSLDKSIYHELLHMASTYYSSDEIDYSGLSETFFEDGNYFNIGLSLNEGYTEVLNKRYFQDSDYQSAYPFESYLSSLLENIIGKEKMESYYLNADLESLIKDLSKYDSIQNIIEFIRETDLLYSYDNYEDREKNLFNIISFFVRVSINKIYSDNFFDNDEDKNKLVVFLESIPSRIRLDDDVFEFDIQNIVDEAFNEIFIKNEKTLKK